MATKGFRAKKHRPTDDQIISLLFPDLPVSEREDVRKYGRVRVPIWSHHKAQFIQQYLKYFVQITHHGTYIDGFAGPQDFEHLDAWTASLVLDSEPKWLRRFFLCDVNRDSVKALQELKDSQAECRDRSGKKVKRTIEIWPGDFNTNVAKILATGKIPQKDATFCLLDQRTFECHWEAVKRLAEYKRDSSRKIELLYFLGVGWLARAASGIRHDEIKDLWWGRKDWAALVGMSNYDIAEAMRKRFTSELGYKSASHYPIYESSEGNRIMYYMVHATDHPEAPALMVRAHHKVVRAHVKEKQDEFEFMRSDELTPTVDRKK